ncbi:hypothetical protein [Isoptericola sp. NPDC055881]
MTGNHARDDGADGRTDEALRRGLDALAGAGAAAPGLDDVLDDMLGTVRRRVRRRRTVKQAGIGATTLAVAAGLVLGGAALLPDSPQPAPGPATTPTPSSSPSSPDGSARDAQRKPGARAVDTIQPGHQPSWLEGTDLSCGIAERDVPRSPSGYRLVADAETMSLGGSVADGDGATITLPTLVTRAEGTPADTVLLGPSLMWVQDGRVVDLGINRTEEPVTLRPGDTSRDAEDYATSSCDPDGVAEGTTAYPHRLPDGDYHVRAFAVLWSQDAGTSTVVVSPGRFRVVLDDDGATIASAEDRVAAKGTCSATGLDVLDPDLTDLPEPVRTTVATMFTAALACDDERLIALAEASDRVDENWGGQSPRELFELPAAEQDEDVYAILARLLSQTQPCLVEAHGDDGIRRAYGWPHMAAGCDSAASHWQDAVDAGALSGQEYEDMLSGTLTDYEGWRLTIDDEGAWQQFVDGYVGPPRGE